MTENTLSTQLGLDSWQGAGQYEQESWFSQRAIEFLPTIQWDLLAARCSQSHHGIPCEISEKFSIGHHNMVRQVKFEDGELWVVRVRMPGFENSSPDQVKRILSSEVASMRFLRCYFRPHHGFSSPNAFTDPKHLCPSQKFTYTTMTPRRSALHIL